MSDRPSEEGGSLRRLELQLPPLPQTLPGVLELLNEPGPLDPREVVAVVRHDPAVAVRLLQKVNSAYYGLRRSVSDIERAVYMMGPSAAVDTILALNVLKLREVMEGPAGACFTRLVRHSVGTAFLARHLLEQGAGGEDSREATASSNGFTEGLLHDFGKFILIYNFPEEAFALYEERAIAQYVAAEDERALEQLAFGCDHTEAGAYAASTLHFPPGLTDVMHYHHAPEQFSGDPATRRVFRAVCAANQATKAMGRAFEGAHATAASLDWAACAAHPVWAPWQAQEEGAGEDLVGDLCAQKKDLVGYTAQLLSVSGAPAEPAL